MNPRRGVTSIGASMSWARETTVFRSRLRHQPPERPSAACPSAAPTFSEIPYRPTIVKTRQILSAYHSPAAGSVGRHRSAVQTAFPWVASSFSTARLNATARTSDNGISNSKSPSPRSRCRSNTGCELHPSAVNKKTRAIARSPELASSSPTAPLKMPSCPGTA